MLYGFWRNLPVDEGTVKKRVTGNIEQIDVGMTP